MKILAIDFETANGQRVSACSIGLAWIENGAIVRREHRLIRPKEIRFNEFNIFVYKIRPHDVKDKPDFPTVLSEFLPDISGSLVLAHNADFEIGVLCETFRQYGLRCPEFTYLCTRMISQCVWPQFGGTSLEIVADHLGILFKHHDAEEDAVACAKIALAAVKEVHASDILDIPNKTSLQLGKVWIDGHLSCSFSGRTDISPQAKGDVFERRRVPVGTSLNFLVEGSTGNEYEIVAWKVGNH